MRIDIGAQQSIKIVDAPKRIGLIIMNPFAIDVYVSDDQRSLDTVGAADLPSVGIKFPANQTIPVVVPFFRGKWFARAQNPTQLEVIPFEVDNLC
jgi:hypothetical protein